VGVFLSELSVCALPQCYCKPPKPVTTCIMNRAGTDELFEQSISKKLIKINQSASTHFCSQSERPGRVLECKLVGIVYR